MCCGPCEILQCDCGAEFKAALAILMCRHGIKITYSSPRHPESQGLVEQANGQVKRLFRIWKAETGLDNLEPRVHYNPASTESHDVEIYWLQTL